MPLSANRRIGVFVIWWQNQTFQWGLKLAFLFFGPDFVIHWQIKNTKDENQDFNYRCFSLQFIVQ
jgi:hypothetical protein